MTIERARTTTTERKIKKVLPKTIKWQAAQAAGGGQPLPCLTPSVSEQACMMGREKERRRMREEGGAKTGIGIFGGRGILAGPQAPSVMANNAESGRWGWGP